MFGNRMLYTQSPGGIRRGLIWQSGGGASERDPRNFVFDYLLSLGSNGLQASEYVDSGIYSQSGTHRWFQWVPPYLTMDDIPRTGADAVPAYPYITQWATDEQGNPYPVIIASELTKIIYIDAYFDPTLKQLTQEYVTDPTIPTGAYDPGTYLVGQQQYPSETMTRLYYEYMAQGAQDIDGKYFGAQMCCPFRIAGAMIWSDYYFCIYKPDGVFVNPFNPSQWTQRWDTALLNLSIPGDLNYPQPFTPWAGAGTSSKIGGMYSMAFPSFQALGNFVKKSTNLDTNPTAIGYYDESRRILNSGLSGMFNLYAAPSVLPTTILDWEPYQWNASTPNAEVLQHQLPGFDEIHMHLPYVSGEYREFDPYDPQTVIGKYPRYDEPAMQANTVVSSATYFNAMRNTMSRTNASNGRTSGCLYGTGIYNPSGSVGQKATQIPFSLMGFPYLRGNLQPTFSKGQQLVQRITPAIASYRQNPMTTNVAQSARYKYCGFNGYISFFEMQQN